MFWNECVVKAQRLFKLAISPELVGNWMENQPVVASLSPQKDILDSEQEEGPFSVTNKTKRKRNCHRKW